MAPKSNAYARIVLRLVADGAIHRAATETLLRQNGIALTAEEFDELASLGDAGIVGEAMLSVTRQLENISTQKDARVRAAFKLAGLNYKNPFHWKVVLSAFCDYHFSASNTSSARKDEGRSKIIKAVEDAVRKKPSLKGNWTAIATHLSRHHGDYKEFHKDHIRKLIRQAFDPKRNLAVRYPDMKDPLLREIRASFEKGKIQWTPALEKEQTDLVASVKMALDEQRTKLGMLPQYK
jgi:hypothetical protein